MALQNTQKRKQIFSKQDLGEDARDAQRIFDGQAQSSVKVLDAYYQVGMQLGSPVRGEEPLSIVLERCVNLLHADTPSGASGFVDYVWQPVNGGAVVTGLTGLAPSSAIKYRFVFRFNYQSAASR